MQVNMAFEVSPFGKSPVYAINFIHTVFIEPRIIITLTMKIS
jgi:hypothetical protein